MLVVQSDYVSVPIPPPPPPPPPPVPDRHSLAQREMKTPGPGCTTTTQTDPPSAKVSPIGLPELATMTLKIKTVTIPKSGFARHKLSPSLTRQCIWAELQEIRLADFLPQEIGWDVVVQPDPGCSCVRHGTPTTFGYGMK